MTSLPMQSTGSRSQLRQLGLQASRLPVAEIGCVGSVLIMLGSFGAGAVRYQGGPLRALGWENMAYGHGGGISNAVLWGGLIALVSAWLLLGYQLRIGTSHQKMSTILSMWTLPLVFAGPLLSRDVYSYLMQGAMVRDGFDPYTQGAAVNPGPFLLEVSHDWRNTTTPYGPVHLFIGRVITGLTGDHVSAGVICYKVVSLAGFAMIAWAVVRIAQHLDASASWALWMGVANPVVLLHMVGGMHNESVMVGLVSVAIVLVLPLALPRSPAQDAISARSSSVWRVAGAVILIGVAVALKATAIIAFPFLVWMAVAPRLRDTGSTYQQIGRFFAIAAAMTIWLGAVIVGVTVVTGSSWGWVAELSGNSKVINPLAFPSLVAGLLKPVGLLIDPTFSYNQLLDLARTVSSGLMVIGLVVMWWLARRGGLNHVRGIIAAYTVALFFNSVTLPWYFASPLSLAGTAHLPVWAQRTVVTLSTVVALTFTGSGNHKLYQLPLVITLALIGYGAARVIVPRRALKRPLPGRDAALLGPDDPAARR